MTFAIVKLLSSNDEDIEEFRRPAKQVPVLYKMDEAGEAYDVIWFCSTNCRMQFIPLDIKTSAGTNGDWIEGTVCEHCGAKVGTALTK
jgi:hypothetical protein